MTIRKPFVKKKIREDFVRQEGGNRRIWLKRVKLQWSQRMENIVTYREENLRKVFT